MIISGTITQVSMPTEPQGQFGIRYQDITITDQQGFTHDGRIGSKQGYATGAQIQVTVEGKIDQQTNQPYDYFKKYNPQYQQQQAQQQTSQKPQQATQQATEATNAPQGNKETRLITTRVVYKELARMGCVGSSPEGSLGNWDIWLMGDGRNVLKRHVDLIMQIGSGKAMLPPNTSACRPNPDYSDNPPPPADDDIPF